MTGSGLVLTGVTSGYGQGSVLHDVSLSVGAREIVVLLGANGAGKSTLLRTVSRLLRPTGQVDFDGRELGRMRPERVAALGIAHVPEDRGTFPELSVEDNLRVGALLARGRRGRSQDHWMQRCLALFPRLLERRAQAAGSLSGGEQQMLAVARGLMGQPRLLMIDEPSAGLAPTVVQELFAVLPELIDEFDLSLLLVEQNARLALSIAHRAYVLQTGRIVASGSAMSLQDDDSVRRSYLGY